MKTKVNALYKGSKLILKQKLMHYISSLCIHDRNLTFANNVLIACHFLWFRAPFQFTFIFRSSHIYLTLTSWKSNILFHLYIGPFSHPFSHGCVNPLYEPAQQAKTQMKSLVWFYSFMFQRWGKFLQAHNSYLGCAVAYFSSHLFHILE